MAVGVGGTPQDSSQKSENPFTVYGQLQPDNPNQATPSKLGLFSQIPFLLSLGGLVPELQPTIQGLLPQGFKGLPFIDPLEFGPFGGIAKQFSSARTAGRIGLTRRGLQGSGAESALARQLGLQESQANRDATNALLQQLLGGFIQARHPGAGRQFGGGGGGTALAGAGIGGLATILAALIAA